MSVSVESQVSVQTQIGCVKWFDRKAGFGFITVSDGEQVGKDVFVHWSALQVKDSQYKYLVQGEYIEFSVSKPENDKHEFHASSVSGIKSGKLMCETIRDARNVVRVQPDVVETDAPEKTNKVKRVAASKPRNTETDGFVTVSRANNGKSKRAPRNTASTENTEK